MAVCSRCHFILPRKLEVPPSPVPDLIRTYLPPSSSQISTIQQSMADAQSNIYKLDNEISKLEIALNDLRHKRVELNRFTRQHLAILSPMRCLPPEILGDIFKNCLNFCWQDRVFDVREAPLLLSQVCIGWRDAVLSNAKLWSTISLYLQDSISEAELSLVKTWLTRAGGHPLSIRVVDRWQRASHPVLDLILSCTDRWKHVEFCVAQTYFEANNLDMPILESASFPGGARWTQPMNAFLLAPRFHRLYIGFPASSHMLRLPWSQLTELHVDELQFHECLEIIRQSQNLIHCDLGITSWDNTESVPPPTSQIVLSQLRILVVSTSSNVGDLFDHLLVPALLEIQLEQYGTQQTAWVDQFVSLMHRSSCVIEMLHLECDRRIPDECLIRCLQSTPSLITLELGGYKASSLGKRAMTQLALRTSSREQPIVPKLRNLQLQYENNFTFDDGAFADMVASRRDSYAAGVDGWVSLLKTVHVSFFHRSVAVNPESLRRLRKLRDEGLDIRLMNASSSLSLLSNLES